jgi:hypothetical protein
MRTDRFDKIRREKLEKVFTKEDLKKNWQNKVKFQLRSLDIKDIFDFYDFNYNIEERVESIRNDILTGNYRAAKPLIYRVEKKMGICRHIVIPQPSDALVIQTITETIVKQVLENQPSKNAFYSRDKHSLEKPHEIDDSGYPTSWREQWKRMQEKIYKFNESKDYVVVTDLANYYDNIDIDLLRSTFLGLVKIDDVLLDLLFRIIEEISWKPDYLPYLRKGLPVVNIESIRLLAHAFLFELDDVIMKKTNNSFARWMDDITIAADSKKKAVEIVSSISDILKSKGLALNLAKTDIYDAQKGKYNFLIDRNRFLDEIDKVIENKEGLKDKEVYESTTLNLLAEFETHMNDKRPKYWEKVTKRFITAFGRLKYNDYSLFKIDDLYLDNPGVRPNLLIYFSVMGYSEDNATLVLQILKDIHTFDDISLFQITKLVSEWNIPNNNQTYPFIKEFIEVLDAKVFKQLHPLDFYCSIWIKSKYFHPEDYMRFILKYQNYWEKDSFLRRQVVGSLARVYMYDRTKVTHILETQMTSGLIDTVSIANQLLSFSKIETLDKKLTPYLFPQIEPKPYSIQRFLVLCSVLNSEKIRQNQDIKAKVSSYITDEYMKKWLDSYYNIR